MASMMDKAPVLAVDDTATNLAMLKAILREDCELSTASSGEEALRALGAGAAPALVLLDIGMPGIDGLEVCRRMKQDARLHKVPVIFITAHGEVADEAAGFEAGAVDYIAKPFSASVVRARVRTHLALADQRRSLEDEVASRTRELRKSRLEIIRRLGRAAGYRDDDSGQSVIRMSHYSAMLGRAIGLDEETVDTLFHAAPLHDIGKIGISEAILRKPGALNEEEWREMKEHTTIGALIIGKHEDPLLEMARIIAWTHHEKWDGSGYPQSLGGEEIPLPGRIIALADVFDSLTSVRPYKGAWEPEKAFTLIDKAGGTHFEPRLAEAFVSLKKDIMAIREKYPDPPAF
ncbi:MAG TPA: HD domain-containing phosphohydrolase [Holophagaceae bacterium]|nr:HD domain-containing phosphohydrolase [Holophagaceae bacterium]